MNIVASKIGARARAEGRKSGCSSDRMGRKGHRSLLPPCLSQMEKRRTQNQIASETE